MSAVISSSSPAVDLAAVKNKQHLAWSAGDYAVVGTTLQIVGETLCEALDLRAGERVLDDTIIRIPDFQAAACFVVDPDGQLAQGGLGAVARDPDELQEIVAGLLHDEARRRQLAMQAREHAVWRHDIRAVADAYESLFENIRAGGNGQDGHHDTSMM